MILRCPNCTREIDAKDIVALESWKDSETEVVRDVVLVCPGCEKPLAPAAGVSEGRSLLG
jgi:hypothetical protein